jgi:hypothetical protein
MHFANRDEKCYAPDAGPETGSAGAPDIRITAEMISAGISALNPQVIIDLRDGWIRPSEVAERIFLAMIRAAK